MMTLLKDVAREIVAALRTSPLALALVVVNVLFLAFGAWVLGQFVGASREHSIRRDALMAQLAKDCIVITSPPSTTK